MARASMGLREDFESSPSIDSELEDAARGLLIARGEASGSEFGQVRTTIFRLGVASSLLALVGCIAGALLYHSTPMTSQKDLVGLYAEQRRGQLRWSNSHNLCLDFSGSWPENGAPVVLATCETGQSALSRQHFMYSTGSADKIRLASSPDFCVDVRDHANGDGVRVQLWKCIDNDYDQNFMVTDKIHWASHYDKCLDASDTQNAPGVPVQIWTCIEGNSNQRFSSGESHGGAVASSSSKWIQWTQHPDFCMQSDNKYASNGTKVSLGVCLSGDPERLDWLVTESGKIRLASNPKFCLDVKDHSQNNGALMQLWKCINSDGDQDFEFAYNKLRWAKDTDMCVDVKDHLMKPDASFQTWECLANDPDQHFKISDISRAPKAREALPQTPLSELEPRRLRLRNNPELCLATHGDSVYNGAPLILAMCERGHYHGYGPHDPLCEPMSSLVAHKTFLFDDEGGKIRLAANPDYCLDVKDHAAYDGSHLQLWKCIDTDADQDFKMSTGGPLEGSFQWMSYTSKCMSVQGDQMHLGSRMVIWHCSPANDHMAFMPEPAESNEEEPDTSCPQRRGSFIVLGDWGWDQYVHGNLFARTCQRAIADKMLQKMEELDDVKFIVNVGDSFYPDGLRGKQDPQWNTKWRNVYAEKVRSVPWYSVYGNHDVHHDPGFCSEDLSQGAQINGNIQDTNFFYMPDYKYYVEHPEFKLEIVAMEMNKYVDGWNRKKNLTGLQNADCQYSQCPDFCKTISEDRAQQSMNLFDERFEVSKAKNFLVFSHYPTDYFSQLPDFLAKLRSTDKHDMAYYGGHRHNTDQQTTMHTGIHDWLVGGGGGWSCDGKEQGFVVVEIDNDYNMRSYPVLVEPDVCCG